MPSLRTRFDDSILIIYENAQLWPVSARRTLPSAHLQELAEVVARSFFSTTFPTRCLDLACGDGALLETFLKMAQKGDPSVSAQGYVGVESSADAVRRAEARLPQSSWVRDTARNAIGEPRLSQYAGSIDLVLDSGRGLLIDNEEACVEALRGVRKFLREGGLLVVVVDKDDYQHWNLVNCRDWSKDVFEHACAEIGENSDLSTGSHLVYCFRKHVGDAAGSVDRGPRPVSLQFANTGQDSSTYRIAFDALTQALSR